MIDITLNHEIITAPINSQKMRSLMESEYVQSTGIGNIKYGWGVVVFYSWLNHLILMQSPALYKILDASHSATTRANQLYDLAMQAVVYKSVETPIIVSGNIIISEEMHLTKKSMLAAYRLSIDSKNPLQLMLNRICGKTLGINKLCSTQLKKLIALIDFEIPSLSYLLKTLGYNYITLQPYLEQGIMISSCQSDPKKICILYGNNLNKFKQVSPKFMAQLALESRLDLPMTRLEVIQQYPPVQTNDFIEE